MGFWSIFWVSSNKISLTVDLVELTGTLDTITGKDERTSKDDTGGKILAGRRAVSLVKLSFTGDPRLLWIHLTLLQG